jgi:hypothetical protein
MTAQQLSQRAAVSVSEMAAMCDLSRSRFYSLMAAGLSPAPVQESPMKRPVYVRELIEKCLEIRRTGVGLDGRIVVFNRKRMERSVHRQSQKRPAAATTPQDSPNADLIVGLRSLGLFDVSDSQVRSVVRELYPEGRNGHDLGEVIRAVFLHLKKQGWGCSPPRGGGEHHGHAAHLPPSGDHLAEPPIRDGRRRTPVDHGACPPGDAGDLPACCPRWAA